MRRAGLAAGLVVAAGLVACSGGHGRALPTTTAAPAPATTSTTFFDAAAVQLPTVPGQTTEPPVAVTPGPASLNGTVTDDTGAPVDAAIVNLERIVGDRSASTQVTTAADGTWGVQGILGGVYRVRAWRAPDLAQAAATVVFVSATATPPVQLLVTHFTGTSVQAAVAPNPPPVGAPASIVVQVTSAAVGADGVVRQAALTGAVVVIGATGNWAIDGAASQVVGPSGQVVWQGTCEAPGPQPVSVSVSGAAAVDLGLPACEAPPTTTTSGAPPSTTSTTAKR